MSIQDSQAFLTRTIETLFEPGDIVELRMFKKTKGASRPTIYSGLFTDFEKTRRDG